MTDLDQVQPLEHRVFFMKKCGASFEEISQELGVSRDDAMKMYRKLLVEVTTEYSVEEREQIKALELARLDALVQPYYIAGMEGDLDSAKFALAAMQYRAKVLKLDQPTPDELMNRGHVVLVTGSKEDFEEALLNGQRQHLQVTSQVVDDGNEEDL